MMNMNLSQAIKLTAAGLSSLALTPEVSFALDATQPFGAAFPNLESLPMS